MKKAKWEWFNGKFVKRALIPISCQWNQYGLGVFEGIRFYKTRDGRSAIFRLEDHLKRLQYSMQCLGMQPSFSIEDLSSAIIKTIKRNKIKEGYIRPSVGFTEEIIGPDTDPSKVSCAISIWELGSYFSGPQEVKISPFIRPHPESFPMQAKISGTYVNSYLTRKDAKENSFDDALLLDYKGHFAEASVANLFFVWNRGRIIITPNSKSILPGITKDTIWIIFKNKGYRIKKGYPKSQDLHGISEIFVCGTAAEIAPVISIDGIDIGKGKIGAITKMLQRHYKKIVTGQIPKYEKWLEYID